MSTDRAEQKLSEIMSTQHELQEQSEEIKRLMRAEQEYERCSADISELREKIVELETKRASLDLVTPKGATEAVKLDQCIAAMKDELADREKREAALLGAIESLRYIVENNKNFDKNRLFRNIRKLLSLTGVKIGQIERDASCQPGYMSRLEKPGNTTDPSVEFVVTAAKTLEVSIDLLVYNDFSTMTETELYILKFLNNLIKDTKADRMIWKINNMGKYIESEKNTAAAGDPLFNYLVGIDPRTDVAQYRSLFLGKILRCVGNSYIGELRGSNAKMYIMNCMDDSAKKNEVKQFYEIYIVKEDKINPLFCTAQIGAVLVSAVDQLFEAVEIAATHIHINDDVRTIIDLYFNPGISEEDVNGQQQ